jgi:D-sedoheptulose 7-phosphate isomerase|tara:strand:+ start:577 stop:1161 length:585 start_codon:yes stop_codon:yes gene_type:complete
MQEIIKRIQASADLKAALIQDHALLSSVGQITHKFVDTLKAGNQILICGNGGSAADALHLAAEFSGRFYLNRKALPVEALNVNEAALTAISNDFGFDKLYARLLEAKAKKGDVLWLLSTSGKSPNIVNAAMQAQKMGVDSVAFTGSNASILDENCSLIVKVPSTDTPRIQECHLLLGHIICELVEKKMFSEKDN